MVDAVKSESSDATVPADTDNKQVIFKNCTLFTDCILFYGSVVEINPNILI